MIELSSIRSTIDHVQYTLCRTPACCDPDLQLVVREVLYHALRRGSARSRPNQSARSVFSQFFWFIPNLIRMYRYRDHALVISPRSHRNLSINNSRISRHADSLMNWLDRQGFKSLNLEVGNGPGRTSDNPKCFNITFVLDALSFLFPSCRHHRVARQVASSVIASLGELDDDTPYDHMISEKRLAQVVRRWLARRQIIRLLLPLSRKTKLYCVVYYNRDCMALTSTVNQHGGLTFEYQHGIQNNHHPMYSNVFSAGQPISHAIPQHFLAWDCIAAERFQRWTSEDEPARFDCSVIGNLWRGELERSPTMQLDPIGKRTCDQASAVILIALQEWPDTFNMAILAALDCLAGDCLIIVRRHPLDSTPVEVIQEVFSKADTPARISFDIGSNLPAEALFPHCSICVTGYSTIGLDANASSLPCLFTHPNANIGLVEYLRQPGFYYADTAAGIRSVLSSISTNPNSHTALNP